MSQVPIISVVMPVFNSACFIEAAIDSVLQQELQEWELLVVDGGSRDNTREIVARYAAADPRVCLVLNTNDKGPAHARSMGVRHARGEFVAFLDGDDLWLRNKLSDQIDFMRRSKTDFSYTQYRIMDSQGMEASCAVTAYREYGFWSALSRRGIATLTVVAKRSLFTDEILNTYGLSHGEDYLWWLMILRSGVRAKGLMKPLALYRNVESSLSKRRWQHQSSVWRTYRFDLQVPAPIALIAYATYILDVVVRRLRCLLCTKVNGSIQVCEVLA
jgi:teichuronic acid biosynthesis glycosyltransferase TuaG